MPETQSKYPNDSEQTTWLVAAQNGQPAAFDPLVEKYQRPVYNLCYRMLGEATAAEDATQEVFLRAYAKLHSYDPARQFSTWLFAIASHYCLDQLRQRRLRLIAWEDLSPTWHKTPPTDQPEARLLQAEAGQAIQSLLENLSPEYRAVVILKYWHHLSYEEMAHTLQTSVSAIKSKLFRARRAMAAQIHRPAGHAPELVYQLGLGAV